MPKLSDIVAAYRLIFGGEDGAIVLEDLRARFHIDSPTFVAGDPHESAFLEGQRSVVLTIQHMVSPDKQFEGDAIDG